MSALAGVVPKFFHFTMYAFLYTYGGIPVLLNNDPPAVCNSTGVASVVAVFGVVLIWLYVNLKPGTFRSIGC